MKSSVLFIVILGLILITVQGSQSSSGSSCCEIQRSIDRYRDLDPTFMCSVGMHDGRVPDKDITASSTFDLVSTSRPTGHSPHYARLYNQPSFAKPHFEACWASGTKSTGEWIQVNLRKPTRVTGIVTQGRATDTFQHWITGYHVSFSNNGHDFSTIKNVGNTVELFIGNTDNHTPVVNKFPQPVIAQYFRLVVQTWHGHPVLRMDLLTCD